MHTIYLRIILAFCICFSFFTRELYSGPGVEVSPGTDNTGFRREMNYAAQKIRNEKDSRIKTQLMNDYWERFKRVTRAGDRPAKTAAAVLSSSGSGNYQVKRTINLGPAVGNGVVPVRLLVNDKSKTVYCLNRFSDNISVIDIASGELVRTIPVGKSPQDMALDRSTGLIYVTNQNSNDLTVIRAASGEVAGTIAVGSSPSVLAVDETAGRVYVANTGSNNLSVIDESSLEVTATLDVGQYPAAIGIYGGNGYVYVANMLSDDVSVLDGREGLKVIQTLDVGQAPTALAVDQASGRVYVANNGSGTVSVLDSAGAAEVKTVTVGKKPVACLADEAANRIYVANWQENTVSIIDPVSGEVSYTVSTGIGPVALALSETAGLLYVTNEISNSLTIIYGSVPRVIKTIELGEKPGDIVYDKTARRFFVANENSNSVSVIDYTTARVIKEVVVGDTPEVLALNGFTHQVYVANNFSGNVLFLDGISTEVLKTEPVGQTPSGLTVDETENRVFVANWGSDNVTLIDGTSGEVIKTLNVGNFPLAVAVDKRTGRIYVVNQGADQLSVVDLQSGDLLNKIQVGTTPVSVVLAETSRRVYVANWGSNAVSVIEGTSGGVLKTITVGDKPIALAVAEKTGRVYVANFGSNDVSVLDASSLELIKTVAVGDGPWDIAVDESRGRVCVANRNSDDVSVIQTSDNTLLAQFGVGNEPSAIGIDSLSHRIFVINNVSADISLIEDTQHPWVYSSAPEAVSLVAGDENLQLIWNKVEDEYTPERLSYSIYRGLAETGPFVKIAEDITDTTYLDRNLNNGVPYYYRVNSVIPSWNIEGRPSEVVRGTPGLAADYILGIDPLDIEMFPGGTTYFRVRVIPSPGFTGVVALSLNERPEGLEARLDRDRIGTDSLAVLAVSASAGISPGKQTFLVRGVSGAIERTVEVRIQVIEPPAGAELVVAKDSVRVGEALVINGSAGAGISPVELSVKSPVVDTLLLAVPDSKWNFRVEYYPRTIGQYQVGLVSQAGVPERSFYVIKNQTRITLSTNVGPDYVLGHSALVQGKIDPPPAGARIHLEVTSPSGTRSEELMDINSEGFYIRELNFTESGQWYLKAYWPGSPIFSAAESGTLKVPVGLSLGQALIVEGYGEEGQACSPGVVENMGSYAYRVLKTRRYSDQDIHYLSNRAEKDIDGDGDVEVDGPADLAGLEETFQTLKSELTAGPLFLYLAGGGYRKGEYRLTSAEGLSYLELSKMLEALETDSSVTDIIILVDKPALDGFLIQGSQPGRAVIVSNEGAAGVYVYGGLISYSKFMFSAISANLDLYTAFQETKRGLAFSSVSLRRLMSGRGNEPAFDANGDGVYVERDDQPLLSEKYVGTQSGVGDFTPVVEWTTQLSTVPGLVTYLASASADQIRWERQRVKAGLAGGFSESGQVDIRARIRDPENRFRESFAVLVAPAGEVVQVIQMLLNSDNVYVGRIGGGKLTLPGRYTVAVFGVDEEENVSSPSPERLIYLEKNEILALSSALIEPGQKGFIEVVLVNSVPVTGISFNLTATGGRLDIVGAETAGDETAAGVLTFETGADGANISLDLENRPLAPDFRGRPVLRLAVSLHDEAAAGDSLALEVKQLELLDEDKLPIPALSLNGNVLVSDETSGKPLKGDINGDGKLLINDVIVLLLKGRENPADPLVDFNGDGRYNVADAIALLLYIRGQVSGLALSAAEELTPLALTPQERAYLWQMLSQLELNAEELSQLKALIGIVELPKAFSLSQNYPNPFNPSTTISYAIPAGQPALVRLEIYNLRGALVRVLVDEPRSPGTYQAHWEGRDSRGREVSSGVYFYRLRAGAFSQARKMVVLR